MSTTASKLPPTPPGPKLATLDQVRKEAALLYRRVRSGAVPPSEGARMVMILALVAKLIEAGDLEIRITALEARLLPARRAA